MAGGFSSPIVLLDRNPPAGGKPVPAKISYVSVNDAVGGELAAEAVLQLANEAPIRRILVVAGFAKHNRHKAFQDRIKRSNQLTGCEILVTEDGRFDRWVSENIVFDLISDALAKNKPFDAIFCTADSMTVGCVDAINRIRRWGRNAKPHVIGYDGTATTRNLVDGKRSNLVRIVVQDTKALANAALDELILLHQSQVPVSMSIKWVEPYLYPRLQSSVMT
jgi:ABC-type sugar transport system substrate-binding protein